MLFIVLQSLAEIFYFYKGNAKFIFQLNWTPLEWWLYTGLFTNYIGLIGWWGLVESYGVWHSTIICIALHSIISFSLKYYYFGAPGKYTFVALCLALLSLIIGSFGNQ